MKLDATVMRTMSAQDFRLLAAVELGMKDHALVPLPLMTALANFRHGGTHKILSSLMRDKLMSHERKNGMDGYRLTNAGYDILALHNLKQRKIIAALGPRIGTGKESDVYIGVDPEGKQIVLKFHRLGRTSFRNVKKKRDYFGKATQSAHSWLFLSRLSALKEYAFMQALHEVEFPTPEPIAHNRHIVCMTLVRGVPLYQVFPKQLSVEQAASIYTQAVAITTRLAQHGLVHCDLNEFNLLVDLSGIQRLATTSDDPYVRHSGQSVVTESRKSTTSNIVGLLSKPAWEQSLEAKDDMTLPEPLERMSNGEPKPIVVLIDFPQMISVKHPNALELYERDLACLDRFFRVKLQCNIPDDIGIDTDFARITESQQEDDAYDANSRRLDSELKASGSNSFGNRDLELYYYEAGPTKVLSAVEEKESDGEDDDDEDDDDSIIREGDGSIEDEMNDGEPAEDRDSKVSGNDDAGENKKSKSRRHKTNDNEKGNADAVHVEIDMDKSVKNEIGQQQQQSSHNDVRFDLVSHMGSTVLGKDTEERIRARVKKQFKEEKQKGRTKGAFRKGNANKKYVKGKRVHTEVLG